MDNYSVRWKPPWRHDGILIETTCVSKDKVYWKQKQFPNNTEASESMREILLCLLSKLPRYMNIIMLSTVKWKCIYPYPVPCCIDEKKNQPETRTRSCPKQSRYFWKAICVNGMIILQPAHAEELVWWGNGENVQLQKNNPTSKTYRILITFHESFKNWKLSFENQNGFL